MEKKGKVGMALTDLCHDFVDGLGILAGGSLGILTSIPGLLRKSARKLRPSSSRERMRSVVAEELACFLGRKTELTTAKLEERLRVIAEAILAFQEKLNELSVHGPVSEADIEGALTSLEIAESLTDEEEAMLESIFRQNIALQKPEFVSEGCAVK